MPDSQRKFDLAIGASYTGGAAVKRAIYDVAELKKAVSAPTISKTSGTYDVAALREARGGFESNVRQAMAEKIRQIRSDTRKAEVGDAAKFALFGDSTEKVPGMAAAPMGRTAEAVKKVGEEIAKTKHEATGLLAAFEKFGITNGPETLAQKLSVLAPRLALVAAATKAAAFGLQWMNFKDREARHHKQKNLERELADEQSSNETKDSIWLVGPAVKYLAYKYNIMGYKDDEKYIERIGDQTKAQEDYMARQKVFADRQTSFRLSAKSNSEALTVELAKHGRAPEYGTFRDSMEALRQAKERISDANLDGRVPQEAREEVAKLSHKSLLDLKDLAIADFGRTKDLITTLGERQTSIVKTEFEQWQGRHKMIADANTEMKSLALRSSLDYKTNDGTPRRDKLLEADLLEIEAKRLEGLEIEKEFAARKTINDLAAARGAAAVSENAHRIAAEDEVFHQKAFDRDADRVNVNTKMVDLRREELGLMGQLGDFTAKRKTDELGITQEMTNRRQELMAVLQSDTASMGDKGAAVSAGLALPALERAKRALLDDHTSRGSSAPGVYDKFTHGLGQKANETYQEDPRITKAMETLAKAAEEQRKRDEERTKGEARFWQEFHDIWISAKKAGTGVLGIFTGSN